MALTLFLFKVSNLDFPQSRVEADSDHDNQSGSDIAATKYIDEDDLILLVAKVIFRGIHLWSNNVRIVNDEASFIARGKKPKKFNFNLASALTPDDRLRIEFYTINARKRRKKLIAILQIMLENLIEAKSIDIPSENLSSPTHDLLPATVQLKLYYTPPDIDKQVTMAGLSEKEQLIDWKAMFDEEGRHGGHRYRHKYSKNDSRFRKFRAKFIGRNDDADSDSYSDSEFGGISGNKKDTGYIDEREKIKIQHNDLELLQKGLGRYIGNPHEINEWQVMVHIIQGRDFPGLNIDPYVVVQIDDKKRQTGVQKGSNSPYFGEFFTFDFALPAAKIMEKVIFIKVHDAIRIISEFIDTEPIGVFRLDVSTVYNEKDHSFERKWAQLINPENVGAPCGHLLLSISVTERGVPAKNLVSETGQEDDEFKESKTLIPAAMPRRLFPVQLKVTLFSASELPQMMTDFLKNISKKIFQSGAWEPVDSYVEVTYNTMTATTEDRNGTAPVWGEALCLMGRFPPLVRTIKIAVKDHAAIQKDRMIASFFIDLFAISETNPAIGFLPVYGPTWVFLYGSPREYTVKTEQDGLNEGMGEAVSYKGQLLMAIESVPVNPDNTPSMDIQKESGIQIPEPNKFPIEREFLLFGCIFDVSMIDKAYSNSTICFELSIGSSGYLSPNELASALHSPASSLTRPYPRMPISNNDDHFRLPIDLQKPILFTKYKFHDYIYRMALSNRLKHIAERLFKKIRELESKIQAKASIDVIKDMYRQIAHLVDGLSCGCGEPIDDTESLGTIPAVHPNLCELLSAPLANLKMNDLDFKRRKKLSHNIESLKTWIAKEDDYDEKKPNELVTKLNKIARAFQQMASDPQPSLPDVFLWMICDSKRVAYARFHPEDLLFNICKGEKGLYNGRVQTIFLKTPRLMNTPFNASTNAKVQLFLWLGMKEYEPYIFKQLPSGFDMSVAPLQPGIKNIRYSERTYYELRCHCYKARALTAADETGLSDPFLSITVGNETQTTPVLKQSLCPQWNISLSFQNLMHAGGRETAEEIIGHVVVECYDYDDSGDGPDLIGRFSTTAKLELFANNLNRDSLFKWYEFKLDEKRAGELLAVFELVQIDPETHRPQHAFELEEILITPEHYPPKDFVTKGVKNKIYQIPFLLMPDMKTYEIEILFWGLRECRPLVLSPVNIETASFQRINIQPIEHADVTIECAGIRKTRTIKNVQRYPNFESNPSDAKNYTLIVSLPDDENFWPHISILCVQNLPFGIKEIVGNLVVTDLQKYLQKPLRPLSTTDEALANAVNELSKRASYDFNRVRKSVVEAYYAVLAAQDDAPGKKKLEDFEKKMQLKIGKDGNESQVAFINADSLQKEKEETDRAGGNTDNEGLDDADINKGKEPLTAIEKKKRDEMEKAAGWWHKYYASKAQLKIDQRAAMDMNEGLQDSYEVFADFLAQADVHSKKKRFGLWRAVRNIFSRAKKAKNKIQLLATGEADESEGAAKATSAIDSSLDLIEIDRLKELTLVQTFDIVETELENVFDYEGFTDCVDTFPLYKGKGASRSDEMGDDNRIYTKFKGKFRIREIAIDSDSHRNSLASVKHMPRMSVSPILINPELNSMMDNKTDSSMVTNQRMLQFDLNKNPITLKCRLYIIKAVLFRGWDASGKADPFLKIVLNNTTIIDDAKEKLQNTLEPVFGKSFEFDVQIPLQTLLRIQLWDWDLVGSNDLIAETKIDVENRWLSCHRATCGLPKRYDSSGYNTWRDTKKPSVILNAMCETANLHPPTYSPDFHSVMIGEERFDCDPDVIDFVKNTKETVHRKAHHETEQDYIQENTALAVLHGWGKKINQRHVLVAEHVESRALYNPEFPETEQGKLEMWLDIFPSSRPPASPMIDITPPQPKSYQLRLTVFNTADVELSDENFLTGEKTSDIYVKAWILGEKIDSQKTDVHYRSLTGEGNFNWRFVFDFQYLDIEEKIVYEAKDSVFQVGNTKKKIPPRITIRVYDEDFFSNDDFLGECILNLTHLQVGSKSSKKCKADILLNPKHKSINLFEKNRISGWWPMIAPLQKNEIRDKALIGGKLEAEFSILLTEEAEKNPAGKGREPPQQLEEPNRPKTSFLWFTSPLKTLRYVIWGNFKWTILIALVLFVIAIFFLLIVWSLPGEVVHQVATKVFQTGG